MDNLPIKDGDFLWLSQRFPEGKRPFSYGFPLVFPWIHHFPEVLAQISAAFPQASRLPGLHLRRLCGALLQRAAGDRCAAGWKAPGGSPD